MGRKEREEKSAPLGVITGVFVPRSSPSGKIQQTGALTFNIWLQAGGMLHSSANIDTTVLKTEVSSVLPHNSGSCGCGRSFRVAASDADDKDQIQEPMRLYAPGHEPQQA